MSENPAPNTPRPLTRTDLLTRPLKNWRVRARSGLITTLVGFVIFLIGARPGLFGLDRSPVVGFIQIATFLVGLAILSLGGYIALHACWKNRELGLAAQIGLRLVATGMVIALFAGLADIFGMGSHPLPGYPFFGPWQARGVELGQLIIGIGFILMLPIERQPKPQTNEPTSA